jgi:hypothetical protein
MEARAPSSHESHAGVNPFEGYSDEEQPLAGRITLVAAFGASLLGAKLALRINGRELPERPHTSDVVLIGVATHKLSRLLAKSKATSFIRAPFTELEAPRGSGEVDERPRGEGVRRAVGELLVCPYCLSQWISAGFTAGLVLSPRMTRMVAASYTAQTLADFLQVAYRACGQRF